MKNLKKNKGITLIALVITIIVLLILAGVSLSMVLNQDGIFSRAENAGNKYNEAKAREVLETVLLADGKYEKHTNPKYDQEDFLNNLITNEIIEAEIKGDIVIIGDYAFELDRSVPKIGTTTLKPKDLIWPVVTLSEVTQADPTDNYRTAKIAITATIDEKAENGINRIEVWQNGVKLSTIICNNEYSVTTTYKANRNGKYIIKAYADIAGSAGTTVEGIVPVVEFSPNGDTICRKEHSTVITVTETSEKITGMKYVWTNSNKEPAESEFTQSCTSGSTIIGKDMEGYYYLWVMLEMETGTYICGSNSFYFGNSAPYVSLQAKGNNGTRLWMKTIVRKTMYPLATIEWYFEDTLLRRQEVIVDYNAEPYWDLEGGYTNEYVSVVAKDVYGNVGIAKQQMAYGYTMWEAYSVKWEPVYGDSYVEGRMRMRYDNNVSCCTSMNFSNSSGKFTPGAAIQQLSIQTGLRAGMWLNPSSSGSSTARQIKMILDTENSNEYEVLYYDHSSIIKSQKAILRNFLWLEGCFS